MATGASTCEYPTIYLTSLSSPPAATTCGHRAGRDTDRGVLELTVLKVEVEHEPQRGRRPPPRPQWRSGLSYVTPFPSLLSSPPLSTPRSALRRHSFLRRLVIGLSSVGFARARCRCSGVRGPFLGPHIDFEKGGTSLKKSDDWLIKVVYAPELTAVICA